MLSMCVTDIAGASSARTAGAVSGAGAVRTAEAVSGNLSEAGAIPAAEAPEATLTGKTAEEIVAMMGIGWNIGNTFDATGGTGATHETSWGNPKVTKELIHAVKEGGFNVIRIPITWMQEIDVKKEYKIREAFLTRVQEVVDWCYEEGLFVIINVHHESWVNIRDLDKNYRAVGVELAAVWKQIAEHFAEYDQHLIFEGMNEPRMAGSSVEWTGNKGAYQAVNYLTQVFAQTVRADGTGHNAERCLMIPGYAASCSSNIMEAVSLPTYEGKVAGNLIASVHCYSPYNFCLQDKQMTFGSVDEAEVEAVFKAIRSVFLDNGIPVVLGETSATEKNNTEERVKWALCMGRLSQSYGIPIVIWDNGSDTKVGGESHAYINRRTCEWNYPTVVKGLMDGAASTERGSALTGQGAAVSGNAIWSSESGRTATEEWKSSFYTTPAKSSWFAEGREIGIVYTDNGDATDAGEPKLILDSETKQAWWIAVEPTRRETGGDRKVIWYEYPTMMAAMEANGVSDPTDLRNFMLVATKAGVTIYEIVVTGEAKVTYMVNGQRYSIGELYPDDPKLADWVFEGWYRTKKYETEYTKDSKAEGDTVVYAKLRLKTDEEIAAEAAAAATPTPMPTLTPTGTPAPARESATPTGTQTNSGRDDDGTSRTALKILLLALGVAAVAVCAICLVRRRRK